MIEKTPESGESARRPYDARRRRERADEQRQDTRARVIEAATRQFIANGYTATTMTDIAREAGVAMQSVYTAGKSKAELLRTAVDRAIAGDDQEVLLHDRPSWVAIRDEADPVRQVELITGLICEVQERSEPIQAAYRQAAAVDPTVAENVRAAHLRRLETFGIMIRMLPEKRLRRPYLDSIDSAWTIANTEVWLLLRSLRGWSPAEIRAWLARTLIDVLLTPETPPEQDRLGAPGDWCEP